MKQKKSTVIKFIREQGGTVYFKDLMLAFGINKAQRGNFKLFIEQLVASGELVRIRGNGYTLPGDGNIVTGRLSTHPEGYGFVIPDDGGEDIYIPARYLQANMHGDLVEARVEILKRSGKKEGRITRTLERGVKRVVGRYHLEKGVGVVVPNELRITRQVIIPPKAAGDARDGQVVVADLTSWPTERQQAAGRISEILGWPDEPEVEVRSIIAKYELPFTFPPEVLAEAHAVPQEIRQADFGNRTDLRSHLTVTIDGETARDFDDAVCVKREAGGDIRLWVSIADVSHYVKPESPLDREAYLRGTSVYFPDRCIPMLPEELSNGICSLNPGVDRLTFTAEMLFGQEGDLKASTFYPAVIKSAARLTYTIVRQILVDRDEAVLTAHRHLVADLEVMRELALRLMEKRRKRGSIDFDLPEPQIVLDLQGHTEAIVKAERNLAHRLIEEFMLAANEAVAAHIEQRSVPSLYRVHEPPDPAKLADFAEFIFNFGYQLRITEDGAAPRELQQLLDDAAGKPEERMINEVLLRCMKQARYSHENLGHFGLAARSYTHFTSPIRRYPDLVVHRILKEVLTGRVSEKMISRLEEALPAVAEQTSKRERVAMEAEREIVALKKVQFMRGKVGETFDGYITGVSSFGFFVELIELYVEGMVHVSTLKDDYYSYIEKQHSLVGQRSKKVFRIGDKVQVVVAAVSLERRQIEFVLSDLVAAQSEVEGNDDEAYRRVPISGKLPKGFAERRKRQTNGEKPGGPPRPKGRKPRR